MKEQQSLLQLLSYMEAHAGCAGDCPRLGFASSWCCGPGLLLPPTFIPLYPSSSRAVMPLKEVTNRLISGQEKVKAEN